MIRIEQGELTIAAYDETVCIGGATRDPGRRLWTVRVGDTVKYRHRRRSAARLLQKLATDAVTVRKLAGSVLQHRREGIGGGVQQIGGLR